MRGSGETAGKIEFLLLLLLGVLWGIPYALTKVSLTTIPPLTMVAARVSLAAVALWFVVFMLGNTRPKRADFVPRLFVQGCLSCLLPYTLIAIGQRSVDSALAAILDSTTPLFVFFISLVWTRHEAISLGKLFGVSIGLAGVVLLAGAGALLGLGHAAFGQAAIVLATMTSAVSVIHGRRFDDVAPEITAAGTLTSAAIVLLPLSLLVERPFQSIPSAASITALLANAFLATALGFVLYFRLIQTIGSVGTASVGYLKLAVAVLIGCVLMGEVLTWTMVAGLVAILMGVATISKREFSMPSWLVPRGASRAPNSLTG